jgi:threonine dehydrogenase-like Zn-dependent dehydrogenase
VPPRPVATDNGRGVSTRLPALDVSALWPRRSLQVQRRSLLLQESGSGRVGWNSERAHHPVKYDVVVVGGCGHVGLPLAIAFADRGLNTAIYDINVEAVDAVNAAKMPFLESGAGPVLQRVRAAGTLSAGIDPEVVGQAEVVIVVIGTPVDGHLNPDPHSVPKAILDCARHRANRGIVGRAGNRRRHRVLPGTNR